jgi:hypothetical protein
VTGACPSGEIIHDEDAGVVAIKHGQEILYVSLYWRAGFAVNFLLCRRRIANQPGAERVHRRLFVSTTIPAEMPM